MQKLNQEQEKAIDEMLSGQNVFLTGEAGTGKSTVIKELVRRIGKTQNIVVLAPTELTAMNFGYETIHSFFRIDKPTRYRSPGLMEVPKDKQDIYRKVNTIIIDEISMVDTGMFNLIDMRLREANSTNQVFGGKKIICVGDFFKLPPLITQQEGFSYSRQYGEIYAFDSYSWDEAKFHPIILKENHRQSSDRLFSEVLSEVRTGYSEDLPSHIETDYALERLNENVNLRPRSGNNSITLCRRLKDVDAINHRHLEELPGETFTFNAKISRRFKFQEPPAEVNLQLKVGAAVIFLANTDLFHNGSRGVITACTKEGVDVKLDDSGLTLKVEEHMWEMKRHKVVTDPETGEASIDTKVRGTFTQLPLKLGYASTIYESRNMTLDTLHINLRNELFSHGELYTALSRCKKIKNLSFDRKISDGFIYVDEYVIEFNDSIIVQKHLLETRLHRLKQRAMRAEGFLD